MANRTGALPEGLLNPIPGLEVYYNHSGMIHTEPGEALQPGQEDSSTDSKIEHEIKSDNEIECCEVEEIRRAFLSATTIGGTLDYDTEYTEAQLRGIKLAHLDLEASMMQGEQDIREGVYTSKDYGQGSSDKLTQLKNMAALGLGASISRGFQSLDARMTKIMEHYMSVVVPHNQLGLEIAMMEKKEADIQYYKTALARIEFEMKENVHAALDQAKRDIMKKCEERTSELLALAAADAL